ncbi:extracellular solute-binding protein [Amycolatopsis australiensis]|uniref:Carbohydrate ABC transporter substrate-binding protein, CUT1 family n=1 Tax=Amycolatopsis australiensis TaxID=546364 RepID=A0A1K1SNE2_9PSEU|nr:extracellular solute-binding protein [Amycolatopsis australiensis]SFW85843.1 carbohydrate ABC transporter substrate-binding protein, CUT1 family [Amycolatopsis australiensis]
MRRTALAAALAVAAVTATACGTDSPAPAARSGGQLTVWLMNGDLSDQATAAVNAAFEKATGAKVTVQVQEWDNINTKISTALAQDTTPDVIEIGNTDVPLFAANGALTDLTPHLAELTAGHTWLPGLAGPATVNGRSYAAPLFAGNRAVIYDKQVWADAGITAPPASLAELTADLGKVKAKHPGADYSAFHFPGRYWFGALQFVWDAGGQLATQRDGKWTGALESPEAQKGLQAWKDFQNTYSSPASRNADTKAPDQAAVFAAGGASAILDTSVNTVVKNKPELKDRLGTFPFPSATPGKTQPVFLGGSDLAIAAKSRHQDLALAYLEAAADPAVQRAAIVGIDGWTPISAELIDQVTPNLPPLDAAFATAAKSSVATPATPGWATIESDKSINTFFADIATGRRTIAEAAEDFDAHLTQALNAR